MDARTEAELAEFDDIAPAMSAVRDRLGEVIVGQDEAVRALLIALLCRGHLLLVGVPGLAKTLLVRTLAKAVGLEFKRVQFTPDLMPSDILGTELIQEDPATGERSLRFVPGPVFTQLLLADEVNRTPPKTQAALLEAMAERQVTVAGHARPVGEPFVVVATQNPIEQEGTYPLPEAQLDRFLLSLSMGYPPREQESAIVGGAGRILETSESTTDSVLTAEQVRGFAARVWEMPADRAVVDLAVTLARATRPAAAESGVFVEKYVQWGAGPRAGLALVHAAKAAAALDGEPVPRTAHVLAVAAGVLRHRVVVNYAAAGDGVGADDVVAAVLEEAGAQMSDV